MIRHPNVVACVLAWFALASQCLAADPVPPAATRPARPSQAPVLSAKTVLHADVPYGGPDAKQNVLDIYTPSDAKAAPVLIFVHGGEWSRGDKKDISYKPQFLNDNHIVLVAPNYRLSPKDPHPAQVDDLATAIAWTKAHIADYGGDPEKIVIMGHSAGCHLVTLLALDPQYLAKAKLKPTDLKGVISWSGGMFDLVDRAKTSTMYSPFIKATFGESDEPQKNASPMTYAKNAKNSPPFLFASCDDEKSKNSREASEHMIQLINDAGGHAQSATLTSKDHFHANHDIGNPKDDVKIGEILLKFVQDTTK